MVRNTGSLEKSLAALFPPSGAFDDGAVQVSPSRALSAHADSVRPSALEQKARPPAAARTGARDNGRRRCSGYGFPAVLEAQYARRGPAECFWQRVGDPEAGPGEV